MRDCEADRVCESEVERDWDSVSVPVSESECDSDKEPELDTEWEAVSEADCDVVRESVDEGV